MVNIPTVTIFNGIMALLGVYLALVTIDMKRNTKLPSLLLAEEEMKKLKDKKGFISEVYAVQLAFSIIMAVLGIIGFVCNVCDVFSWFKYIEVVIFTIAVVIYMKKFGDAREKHTRMF